MRDAAAVFSRALVLIALLCRAEKTFKVELLTGGEASRIEFRLIQGGPATWLTNANNHQKQRGHEDKAAEVILHEEILRERSFFGSEVKNTGTIDLHRAQVNS